MIPRRFVSLCAGTPRNDNRADSGSAWGGHAETVAYILVGLLSLPATVVFAVALARGWFR